jgi:hypothetical protein
MMRRPNAGAICSALLTVGLAGPSFAQDAGRPDDARLAKENATKPHYSPYAGRNFLTQPFFGDTHLHTSYSFDAGAFGARLAPRDAYAFAKGNEITASAGERAKLSRPLDFLVVTDHSDAMRFFPLVLSGAPAIMSDRQGRKWHEMIISDQGGAAAIDITQNFGKGTISKAILPVPGTPAYRGA